MASLKLDARTTALVLIDLQKGVLARETHPYPVDAVIGQSVKLGARFNELSALVVPVHVGFSADMADRPPQAVDAPMAGPPGGFPADFAELVPAVANLKAGFKILKRQWGAFHGTELDLQFRRRGISTMVICGVSTNFGVEQTVREGWQLGYSVVVAEDACGSAEAAMHQFSIDKILPRLAKIRTTAEIIEALGG